MNLFKTLAIVVLSVLITFSVQAGDKLKVGFIYVGPVGDHGWTYMHDQGRLQVEKELGDKVETTYVENVPEGADAERVITQMALQGVDLIFATSFGYMEQMLNVAKKFPDVKFEHATGYKTAPNMSVYSSKFYEGRYVQGVIAGMMSKNGKAGYIASFPIPEVIRGINSFYLGATSINPDFDIDVVWVNTWYDPAKEGDAAKVLISQGADIITQHTDSTAPLQIAEKEGVLGFGQASDMISFAPNTQLTAIIDDWGPYYVARVQAVLDGSWESEDTFGGMDTGMVKMAPMTNMPPAVSVMANNIAQAIEEGVLDPFGGKFTIGELLGMKDYLPGIDATKP
jgi:simple sugar transport system substrate-binding protein|tara:strand:+ start:132 stop:1151 length:1020 start_codon:yes stop_codon:yes gene_type:complete